MDKIAIFIDNYLIDNSPSIIYFMDLLSDHYMVDLYVRRVFLMRNQVLRKSTISIFVIKDGFSLSAIPGLAKKFIKKIVKILLFRYRSDKPAKANIVSVDQVRKDYNSNLYKEFICFDPNGFLLCKQLFKESKPIYYSLELHLKRDLLGSAISESDLVRLKGIMSREHQLIGDVKKLIIQSEERAQLFKDDYKLPVLPTFLLPVTLTGPAVKEKSNYLRDTYRINKNTYIALHLGGMNDWFSCIEMAESFSELDNWVLFFQGNHVKDYLARFRDAIKRKKITNVIVSHEFYDELSGLETNLRSSDLGIAWYKDISKNLTTAGKSSGKIVAYMKFGLPIIAKGYPSTVDAIERSNSGLCIDDFNELCSAVKTIQENHSQYARSCRREYEKNYRFEIYKDSLLNFIGDY